MESCSGQTVYPENGILVDEDVELSEGADAAPNEDDSRVYLKFKVNGQSTRVVFRDPSANEIDSDAICSKPGAYILTSYSPKHFEKAVNVHNQRPFIVKDEGTERCFLILSCFQLASGKKKCIHAFRVHIEGEEVVLSYRDEEIRADRNTKFMGNLQEIADNGCLASDVIMETGEFEYKLSPSTVNVQGDVLPSANRIHQKWTVHLLRPVWSDGTDNHYLIKVTDKNGKDVTDNAIPAGTRTFRVLKVGNGVLPTELRGPEITVEVQAKTIVGNFLQALVWKK